MIGLVCWCDEEDLIVLMKAKPYLHQNGKILINIEKAKRKTKKEKKKSSKWWEADSMSVELHDQKAES